MFENLSKLTKRLGLLILIFLVGSVVSFAGTVGKIAGKIVNKETGEPMPGANIVVTARWAGGEEIELTTMLGSGSNTQGEYFILNLQPGLYTVKATYIGYTDAVRTQVRVNVDRTTRINFDMESKVITGEEVVVTAYRPDKIEPDLTATKQTYSIAEVDEIVGVNDIEDVINLQADVIDNHFRGGREGESLYLIDGSTIVNPIYNSKSFNPMIIGLEQVEVLTSGFSAEYGNVQSGIVNMVAKEGGNKWSTRVDISSSLPHYKHWGGNFYDLENNPWYQKQSQAGAWLEESEDDLLQGFGRFLSESSTWEDSLYTAKLRQAQFLQFYPDIGREYKDRIDYRFDISTGGPISKNMRLFIATRQEVDHYVLPTPTPDINRQMMGNLVYRPDINNKLKLSYTYSKSTNQDLHWGQMMQSTTVRKVQRNNYSSSDVYDIGLKWEHVFSPSTFMDWNLKMLNTSTKLRLAYVDPDDYEDKAANQFAGGSTNFWNGSMFLQVHHNRRGEEKTKTYNLDGNITSQINSQNLLKAGVQLFYYDLDYDVERSPLHPKTMFYDDFVKNPVEGAIYVQDKMEFEGMIANLGLRLDFYNFNTDYYSDIFAPLRNPNYDPNLPYLERGSYYDRDLAATEKTKLFSRLQPRIGIAFPVSEATVVHVNYGTSTQRPGFEQIFYNRITPDDFVQRLGNASLKPENTTAYDVGLVQGLPFGIRLDISAYYKDVKDLMEVAYYTDTQQNVYMTWHNLQYANIKGFHFSLEKYTGNITAIVRYNYQSATGKASSPWEAPINYFEEFEGEPRVEYDFPDPEDIYLSYDRTHRLVCNLRYNTSSRTGPEILSFRPFANVSFNANYVYQSGRPYTWDEFGLGLRFNKRTPGFGDLRIRLQKQLKMNWINTAVYVEVFNVLNQKEYAYTIFQQGNEDLTWRWENEGEVISLKDGKETKVDPMIETERDPYLYREDIRLLRNMPRYWRLGMTFNF